MADPAIQKRILKAVLSLPRPVLRAASGARVVYVGGRTLDPRLQFLLHAARHYASVQGLPEEKARRIRAQHLALVAGRREPGVEIETVAIDGPRGALKAQLYRHPGQDPAMALMVFGQGSRAPGDPEVAHAFCSVLARCGRMPVLALPCRPEPERRFRARLEELAAAYRFGRDNAARFGAPAGVAALGGEGIGGSFAAILCQELKRTAQPQPSLQLLLYPWLDLSPSGTAAGQEDAIITASEIDGWTADWLFGPDDDPSDPVISPLKAEDVSELAPAIVVTAGFDPLIDQGEAYARRLRSTGAPVVYRCYDNLVHGFTGFTGAVPAADVACREIAGLVREGLQGRIPCPRLSRTG